MLPDPIQVRFQGGGISLARIGAGDLARVLKKLEDYVSRHISTHCPGLPKDKILVSLSSVANASAGYGFDSLVPDLAAQSFYVLGRAIEGQNYIGVDKSSIEFVKVLSAITRKYDCIAELTTPRDNDDFKTIITPVTQVASLSSIEGETSLYGYLQRIGGAEPSFALKISEDVTIYGDISAEDAKALSPRLYTWVGISGVARWDSVTGDILEFRATSISPYVDVDLKEAIDRLSDSIGKYWDEEIEVGLLLSSIREDGDL